MPSTYTTNNGIELIATGEQSGTWGSTTNTNFELLDTALDGQVSVTLGATGSSGSPNTLPVTDGAASNGRNRLVIFGDGGDLGGTAYVQLTPNNAEKIVYVRNNLSGSRSILLFQGTYSASNDYEIPAGKTAVVFFDGAGSGAVAANIFNNAHFDAMNIVGNVVVGGTVSATGNITTSGTVEPAGDTAAGDNAAIGYTAAEGLILTGQGSTNDVTIKNDADADVLEIPTGTTNVTIAGNLGVGGTVTGTGTSVFASLDISGDIDVDGTTNLDVVDIDGAVDFASTTAHAGNATFADNAKAIFGAGSDLQIYHDGSHSYLYETGTGEFRIKTNGNIIQFLDNSNNYLIKATVGAEVGLYFNTAQKLATTNTGIDITGNAKFADNGKAIFGAGSDLEIYHDGSNSYIQDTGTGDLFIEASDDLILKATGSNELLRCNANSSVQLFHNGAEKLNTTTTGIDVTGTVTDDGATHDGDVTFTGASANAVWDKSDSSLEFADNSKAKFGTGADLQIFHDGTDSKIFNYTGDIILQHAASQDITFKDAFGNLTANFRDSGAVTLYHNASQKFETSSSGVTVTGTVAATSYTGDGSNLTGIAAGATGGGSDEIFWENGQNVTTNYTITNGKNAMSAGPITIDSGVTVTVGSGETWTVV